MRTHTLALTALLVVLAATSCATNTGTPEPGGGRDAGTGCSVDTDCASGACEMLADKSGRLACAVSPCAECEGIDSAGRCVALDDGDESASCGGTCSGSYAGPTAGARVCCSAVCTCTTGGMCPAPAATP